MDGWDFEVKHDKSKRKFIHFEDLILFEDERILVANKPAGISSLADRDDKEVNLLQLGRKYNPGMQLCHRLDKLTTGAIIFAKTPEVYREMAGKFARREVLKHYLALVQGARQFDEFPIEAPISVGTKGKARIHTNDGKYALTVVSTAEIFRECSLLDCHPVTGRMHQVRVHLASVGAPLIGDDTYGGKDLFLSQLKRNYKAKSFEDEKPLTDGFLLHARGVSFSIPGDEEEKTFIAPIPPKMEVVLKILRKYGA